MDHLLQLFGGAGLTNVAVEPLDGTAHFVDFDDYWSPFLAGQGAAVSDAVEQDWNDDGPGVAIVAADRTVDAATPAAARWLEELAALDAPQALGLPTVVRAVIERLEAGVTPSARALIPRVRVRAPSGRWLVVHASHLHDDDEDRVAVVIEPASPAALSTLVIAAYGLTAREAEIAQRVLAGWARKAIAAELRISLHTVNDHVKAVFDKSGVSSAGQLRARVLSESSPH